MGSRLRHYPLVMSDRLYFRQLLSGRDFARGDQAATQMRNFAYLIGDTETREAVLVDPAYAAGDLLDTLEEIGRASCSERLDGVVGAVGVQTEMTNAVS